jgi:hypothetical protein
MWLGGASGKSGCTANRGRGQQETRREAFRFPVMSVMSVMSVKQLVGWLVADGVVSLARDDVFFCQSLLTHFTHFASLTPSLLHGGSSSYRLGRATADPNDVYLE